MFVPMSRVAGTDWPLMADRPPFTTLEADVRNAVAHHLEHGGWSEHNASHPCRCAGCRLVWAFAELDSTRQALNDMWACIGVNEISDLQPETIEVACANHDLICHED